MDQLLVAAQQREVLGGDGVEPAADGDHQVAVVPGLALERRPAHPEMSEIGGAVVVVGILAAERGKHAGARGLGEADESRLGAVVVDQLARDDHGPARARR